MKVEKSTLAQCMAVKILVDVVVKESRKLTLSKGGRYGTTRWLYDGFVVSYI